MHIEAHAGLGWAIGVLAPGSDRRLRCWCTAAAVLPDIDVVSFLFGPVAYMNWHHTFGHNVFLGAIFALAAAWAHRDRPPPRRAFAGGLVALAFGSHLLTDAKLSFYPVYLFWPVSGEGYMFEDSYALVAPINTYLVYASFGLAVVLAFVRHVTPLDLVSSRLDRVFLNFFRPRTLACATCGRRCNERCDVCGGPTCMRHGRLGRGFRVACPRCVGSAGTGPPSNRPN